MAGARQIDPCEVYRAGRVMRWHSNPDMSHVADPVDGHSARVARLILALHPKPSAALIAEALTHDDGEMGVGDIASPAKDADPELARKIEILEVSRRVGIWGVLPELGMDEMRWLRLCDRLDAWMVMAAHRPDLKDRPEWRRDRARIMGLASDLGCAARVGKVLG